MLTKAFQHILGRHIRPNDDRFAFTASTPQGYQDEVPFLSDETHWSSVENLATALNEFFYELDKQALPIDGEEMLDLWIQEFERISSRFFESPDLRQHLILPLAGWIWDTAAVLHPGLGECPDYAY